MNIVGLLSVHINSLLQYSIGKGGVKNAHKCVDLYFERICTVRKKDIILRSIERRPQMQFSMVRKFPLWRLRRYSVKFSKVRNFTFNTPCRKKLNNTCWERTNILWICSPPLYHCATLTWKIEGFFQFLPFFFAKFIRLRNSPHQCIPNGRNCVTLYAA